MAPTQDKREEVGGASESSDGWVCAVCGSIVGTKTVGHIAWLKVVPESCSGAFPSDFAGEEALQAAHPV
jgi:hypothetical protein